MKSFLFLCAVGVLFCFAAVPASADHIDVDSLPSCTPGMSISSLQQSGGCKSGSLLFSHFQYNNSGLQISHGVFVTPSNVLVTATPFSITFSTDYGVTDGFKGGFTNCPEGTGGCQEEEGSLGYDVSVIRGGRITGLGLFGGDVPGSHGGHVADIACMGPENDANVILSGFTGYSSHLIPYVCHANPSASVLLNGEDEFGNVVTPSVVLFRPVSTISVAISLFVAPAIPTLSNISNVTPFSNAFLVDERAESEKEEK
jgi:hypothetical protein